MTPEGFVSKWSQTTTKEKASSQEHFLDLCRMIGEKTPNEADPTGEWYAFEKGVEKTGAGRGWADVWKRGHFGWEYKSKSGGKIGTMAGALRQLQLYALALESPPLLIVSDIDTIEIHTAFQNAVQEVHTISNEELVRPEKLALLRWAFNDPERLRPKRTRDQITTEAAGRFADLAFELRKAGHEPLKVAHFLNRILFCMFAEDAGLLKSSLFTKLTEKGVEHPEHFDAFIKRLFQTMQKGGLYDYEIVDWFNGGLFDDDDSIPLNLVQIRIVRDLSRMDWSQIEPAIFGTLFERGLDPDKRSQFGAHYTDPQSIMRLVTPTIEEPLLQEWAQVRERIASEMQQMEKVKTKAATDKRRKTAQNLFFGFIERLREFRVLDPACGSGNFLYLALQALKRIEHRANIEAEALGLERQAPMVGPEAVLGIEINAYAAELARVTVWIGEIQWMIDHGYQVSRNPILKPLDNIENRDAILNEDGTEPDWPKADVIVGNPPFLGDKKMVRELGEQYVTSLRHLYRGSVPGGADLVTYWFEKSRRQLASNYVKRVGLVATNSIRGGKNRTVVDRICEDGAIYSAFADEPWVNEGAAVRVSLVCYGKASKDQKFTLDGHAVSRINSDLTALVDLTQASKLQENENVAFIGDQKGGDFDIDGSLAREWLSMPNPHGKPNSDVLRPWVNGLDITRRPRGKWIIDFPENLKESECACYEAPFQFSVENIKSARKGNRESRTAARWWLHQRSRPAFRDAAKYLSRFIVTPRVSKHRVFVWANSKTIPDSATVAIAREDDQTFGILQSRFHTLWTLGLCTWLGVGNDPRYTPSTTFETFPFPSGLSPNRLVAEYDNEHTEWLGYAAAKLSELREQWLNPSDWVSRIPEKVGEFPDRIEALVGHESDLAKRTLTNLYNASPTWLNEAHAELDRAVSASYGISASASDTEVLEMLLSLNAEKQAEGALPLISE